MSYRRSLLVMSLGMVALVQTRTADAHHSYAAYEGVRTMTIVGTVKDFQWTNPHAYIEVMVESPNSAPVQWAIEMGSPLVLKNGGWNRNLLRPGDKISAVIHPRRDGGHTGSVVEVTLPDGTVKKSSDRAAAAAAEAAEAKGQQAVPPPAPSER